LLLARQPSKRGGRAGPLPCHWSNENEQLDRPVIRGIVPCYSTYGNQRSGGRSTYLRPQPATVTAPFHRCIWFESDSSAKLGSGSVRRRCPLFGGSLRCLRRGASRCGGLGPVRRRGRGFIGHESARKRSLGGGHRGFKVGRSRSGGLRIVLRQVDHVRILAN
jgi:hypothetical protein